MKRAKRCELPLPGQAWKGPSGGQYEPGDIASLF
jgi:hypothetical protein